MELAVSEHVVKIVIISPQGRLDAFSTGQLKEELNRQMEAGVNQLLIDLTDTSFLDSAGMAVLVSSLKATRQTGGDTKLVWPEEEAARRILRLTRFDRVFDIRESQLEAIKAFFSGANLKG